MALPDPLVPPPRGEVAQLARLSQFLWPLRLRIAAALAALLVAAGCVLALGQGLRWVIDRGFGSGDAGTLNATLFGVIGVSCVLAAATFVRFYLMMSTGERVIADLRRAVFDHVLSLSPAWFDAARTGEVVSRLANDTEQIRAVIGFGLSLFLRNALMMAGALVLLFVTSPKLAGLIVLGVPATLVPILVVGRRVRRLSRENQDRVADVAAHVDESVHEIRTVQAYGHEDADRRQFAARAESAYRAGERRVLVKAWLISFVMLIGFCAVGVILWIGGQDVIAGRMSAGELSAFVFYAGIVATGAATVSEIWGEIQRAAGATERLLDLLHTRPGIEAPAHPLPMPQPPRGEVRLDRVGFHYPSRPQAAALSEFSLSVRPGERVALVGPSGAGKSTVFQLLLRYYDPSAGRIEIDGTDSRAADPRELRRRFALVPQDPVIFAASVADNLRYGRPDASDAELREACTAAYALEFVEALPEGFGTWLGERGVRLSGGQRQRLSIARALLADRAVLLLDEATSSLDAESERVVQLALARLMRGRTTLIIAHRLATVRGADRIVVMDHGRIVSMGTHAELMRSVGLYADLARLQFLAEPDEAVPA